MSCREIMSVGVSNHIMYDHLHKNLQMISAYWRCGAEQFQILPPLLMETFSSRIGYCPLSFRKVRKMIHLCTPCILYTVPIEGMNRLAKLWRKGKKSVRARSLLRCSAMWMKNQVAVVWMYDRLAFRGEKARLCIVDDDSTVSTSLSSLLL